MLDRLAVTGQPPAMDERSEGTGTAGRPVVVQEPGLSLTHAAAWVGHACWAELRWHQVLTSWLADEADAASATRWWSLRADAAERAEAWHRRLPELRELPRSGFVQPPTGDSTLVDTLDHAETVTNRPAAVESILDHLTKGYEAHQRVAVGPADGPAARTLTDALTSIARSRRSRPVSPAR